MSGPIEPPLDPQYGEPTYQPYSAPPVMQPEPPVGYPGAFPGTYTYPSPYPPPPPVSTPNELEVRRRRSQRFAIIATVVTALLIGGYLLVADLTKWHPKHHPLAAPDQLSGDVQTAASDQIRSLISSTVPNNRAMRFAVQDAAIAAYAANLDGDPHIVLVAIPMADVPPSERSSARESIRSALGELIGGSLTPVGAYEQCGVGGNSGVSITACAWSDSKTVGYVLTARPALPVSGTAAVAEEARQAVER